MPHQTEEDRETYLDLQKRFDEMMLGPHLRAGKLRMVPWREHLTEEQRHLAIFARLFASHFDTGTDDCKHLSLIARLADLLDETWGL